MSAYGPGLFRRLSPHAHGDSGVALLAVIGAMAITSLFLLSSLAYTIRNAPIARQDQDAKTAAAAAQAGLDEYVARLSADSNYWENGNSDAGNAAFGSGQVIQGTGTAGARYTYQLLTTPTQVAQTGLVRIRVTGTSTPANGTRPASRTLTATLQPKGFLSFIYLSDVEVVDPELANDVAACGNYYYAGRSSRTDCGEIQWTGGDTVNGPLHSNDALQINGAVKYLSPKTESGWPAINGAAASAKTWWGSQSPLLPNYAPKYSAPLSLPTGNTELLKQVQPDVDGDGSVGDGCYYTGATRITLQGTTMTVHSPSTSASNIPSRCLNVSNRANAQAGITIPPVIYVDSTTASCTTPASGTAGVTGIPKTNEAFSAGSSTAPAWGNTANYHCQRGSVYIEGNADAQVTVAAKDDVVVTGDVTLQDAGTGPNVVGLIAGNYVWVYHPIRSNNTNLLTTTAVDTIQAAVLSLRHSFVVQNWNVGSPLGTLNVQGAIAQKFRGPVGTGSGSTISTGYYKNYVYDGRLGYLQPPYFLKPTSSPWAIAAVTDK